MTGFRGRPRKVKLEQVAEVNIPSIARDLPISTPTNSRRLERREAEVEVGADRLAEVVAIVQPHVDSGSVTLQAHNNCITVRRGNHAECINIGVPDKEVRKLVARVINAPVSVEAR